MNNNDDKRPLYQQVKKYIEQKIVERAWPPNTKIPSENELLNRLKVSRMTVNRALRELTSDGYLERVQGVGTFVAGAKPQSAMLEIRSIAEEIKDRGGEHTSKVITLEETEADQKLAHIFGILEGTRIFHSVIVHFDNGTPIQLADRYINPEFAPEYLKQDFTKITVNEYLLKVAPATEVEHIIEAVLPDDTVVKHLNIVRSNPCLLLNRQTWIYDKVVTRSCFYYPAEKYKIGGRFKPTSGAHRIIT